MLGGPLRGPPSAPLGVTGNCRGPPSALSRSQGAVAAPRAPARGHRELSQFYVSMAHVVPNSLNAQKLKPQSVYSLRRRHITQKSCSCQTIENIGNQIQNKNKYSTIWECWNPLEPRLHLELKIQLLAEFYPPSVWHKIHWYPWTLGKSVC